jgi:hypothetical protein
MFGEMSHVSWQLMQRKPEHDATDVYVDPLQTSMDDGRNVEGRAQLAQHKFFRYTVASNARRDEWGDSATGRTRSSGKKKSKSGKKKDRKPEGGIQGVMADEEIVNKKARGIVLSASPEITLVPR